MSRATDSSDGSRYAGNERKCEGRHFTPGSAATRRFAREPKMDARSKKTDSWILDFGSHCFLEPTAQDWDAHWRVEGGVARLPPRIGTLRARYQVPGGDPALRTVRAPENGGPTLPNSAARTANFILNL